MYEPGFTAAKLRTGRLLSNKKQICIREFYDFI
jgi:hypothetical protein